MHDWGFIQSAVELSTKQSGVRKKPEALEGNERQVDVAYKMIGTWSRCGRSGSFRIFKAIDFLQLDFFTQINELMGLCGKIVSVKCNLSQEIPNNGLLNLDDSKEVP